MVIKGGLIAWSEMGDANASIFMPQLVLYRPMFGGFGSAPYSTSVTFTSQAPAEAGVAAKPGFRKRVVPVRHCRTIARRDMVLDSATPRLEVDPETYELRAGPVGSGKTALVGRLSPRLADRLSIAAVTNDIYTREDAGFLIRVGAQTSKHFGSLTHARAGGCGFHREWRR
jgi:hypothetical protein